MKYNLILNTRCVGDILDLMSYMNRLSYICKENDISFEEISKAESVLNKIKIGIDG